MSALDASPCVPAGHPGVDRWNAVINAVAPTYGVPPNLVKAHMLYESGGDPTIVGGSGRGLGLMQLDYGTAKNVLGLWYYSGPNGTTYKVFDPATNVLIACRDFIASYIAQFGSNLGAIVCAYNAGPGPTAACLASGGDLTKVTFAPWYIGAVTGAYAFFTAASQKASNP